MGINMGAQPKPQMTTHPQVGAGAAVGNSLFHLLLVILHPSLTDFVQSLAWSDISILEQRLSTKEPQVAIIVINVFLSLSQIQESGICTCLVTCAIWFWSSSRADLGPKGDRVIRSVEN